MLIYDECILSPLCFGREGPDRRILYCLRCKKAFHTLPVHLKRVCMRGSTAEERVAELKRAKESQREWTRVGRRWEYRDLCSMVPDSQSRQSLVGHLTDLGFFVVGQPGEDPQGAGLRWMMLMI